MFDLLSLINFKNWHQICAIYEWDLILYIFLHVKNLIMVAWIDLIIQWPTELNFSPQGVNLTIEIMNINLSPSINYLADYLIIIYILSSFSPFFFHFSCSLSLCLSWGCLASVGVWFPVCDSDISVFTVRGECGSLHEENLLQAVAAVLHSPGHWYSVLQRPLSTNPRGRVDTWGKRVYRRVPHNQTEDRSKSTLSRVLDFRVYMLSLAFKGIVHSKGKCLNYLPTCRSRLYVQNK